MYDSVYTKENSTYRSHKFVGHSRLSKNHTQTLPQKAYRATPAVRLRREAHHGRIHDGNAVMISRLS